MSHYLYILRLVPRLHEDAAWTDADRQAVGVHFAHLQAAAAERQVIIAGRTVEPAPKTFGLVIFEAPDETAARAFMLSDPGIKLGIMTAELHPYQIAVQRS